MNTSLTGHQSHAIKGSVLRVAATNVRATSIYTSSFLAKLATWGQGEGKCEDGEQDDDTC